MPPAARPHRLQLCAILGFICILGLLYGGLFLTRALFPLRYQEEILHYSDIYHLDPAWVASVIRCESRFESDALSPAGAIGLMQIMPETGDWIAQELQQTDYSTSTLTSPAQNISLGTWYLRTLLDRFTTRDVALMAYNAGPSNAEAWEGNLALAFPETQRYIRRIHLALPVYRVYFAAPWLLDLIPSRAH
ncbi:lytic transglycosylase domain-containing protein [Candidatus Bipolaricaulota bacterium]|nr:lytic transglycosylase domain-containing protein [Candidatus Bipolaricaulota bacterium]TFH11826.1 MAG: lytic transglycosylase domain-containing protein [Candidatus Atribacteria bacterium]